MKTGNTPHQLAIPTVITLRKPQYVIPMDGALYLQAVDSAPMQSVGMDPSMVKQKMLHTHHGLPKVVTDHQPLTGIFGDMDLSKVYNPCIFRLKDKCFRYSFSIQHCPG